MDLARASCSLNAIEVANHSVLEPSVIAAGRPSSTRFASVVFNQPVRFWGLSIRHVLIGTLVILAQMLAIFALLWQRSWRKKTELNLVSTNDRLRAAMESGKSVGWEFELASRKTHWFGDLRTMFGIPSNTFIGQVEDFYHAVHSEDRERVSKAVAKARDNHEPFNQEFRVLRADGAARWVASSGEFQYTPGGKALTMRGLAVDVTERKQLDE